MSAESYTLGINAAFHDSAACLVRDGGVVAAAEEERFTRISTASVTLPLEPSARRAHSDLGRGRLCSCLTS